MEREPIIKQIRTMNKVNLLKLADYLEGELKAVFNMEYYADMSGSMSGENRHNCGSVGCAVGHAPYAGITKLPNEPWETYALRVFDVTPHEFDFLFHGRWGSRTIMNDPNITACRIRYFVVNGVPIDWDDNWTWTPPVAELPVPQVVTVYKTIVIDSPVKELATKEMCPQ